jgi:histidyl-tRNA synthetase
MKLQTVRGTRDIFGSEAQLFREIEQQFIKTARVYDFVEMDTPIFEFTQVFKRTLGDDSDIVNKEMYTFEDRSGDSLTLRPEGTASVARAVISNSLLRDLPLKLFYSGPMFRHERPQKGRYRQFKQFGIELIGVPSSLADREVLACAWDFFRNMNLTDKVHLELNTIGDTESRRLTKKLWWPILKSLNPISPKTAAHV